MLSLLTDQKKWRNIEVDRLNVVEYLSHAGLKLERLLAFIESKNQTLKDDEAFIVS